LKDPKHKPSHVLSGQTNFANIALGKKISTKEEHPIENEI
jgi:hypothetical protein